MASSTNTHLKIASFLITSYVMLTLLSHLSSPASRASSDLLEDEKLVSGYVMRHQVLDDVKRSRSCKAMFTVDKDGGVWTNDGAYAQLRNQLPSFLQQKNGGGVSVYPGTRLLQLNGSLPYVPCKVRQYTPNDLGQCTSSRSSQDKRTWIAFFGDSNGRQKVHSFLYFLPPEMEYTYFLGDREVTRDDFLVAVYYHHYRPLTFDVLGKYREKKKGQTARKRGHDPSKIPPSGEDLGPDLFSAFKPPAGNSTHANFSMFGLRDADVPLESYDLRLTLIWAPLGSRATTPAMQEKVKVTRMNEWAEQEVIPDVIVMAFGKWTFLQRETTNELKPFTELEFLLRPLMVPLTKLSTRTTVLWWHQSRYRWFNFETKNHTPWETNRKKYWEQELYMNQFRDGFPLLDPWVWQTHLKHTGIWQWDSTVPLNLANFKECHSLRKAGVIEDKLYTGRWWNCRDAHHSSYETNFVEIQMLLNLLCNPFIANHGEFCCAGMVDGSFL